MSLINYPAQLILSVILLLSSLGVILAPKPVHACLSFLLALLMLAGLYLQLSAEFIAVMQVIIYAGAVLVLFMFVIVLFQDAHQQISRYKAKSAPYLLLSAGLAFSLMFLFLEKQLSGLMPGEMQVPEGFGSAQSLGHALYIDFFFPFEAIILIFLVALIGTLYIAKQKR